jgi:hypothetical protein
MVLSLFAWSHFLGLLLVMCICSSSERAESASECQVNAMIKEVVVASAS